MKRRWWALAIVLLALGLVLAAQILARMQAAPPAAEPVDTALPAPAAETLAEGYLRPIGRFHPGTAGSSLGLAQAACGALRFAAEQGLDRASPDALRESLALALAGLSEEEQAYARENFPAVAAQIELVRADFSQERGRYEDAGVSEEMEQLLRNEGALRAWDALRAATEAALGQGAAA